MPLIEIHHRSEIEQGKLMQVVHNDQIILLLRHQEQIKAFQGTCPHQGTLLTDGHVSGNEIVCPGHQWRFSCVNGHHAGSHHLKQYQVVEREGRLFVDVDEKITDDQVAGNKRITLRDLPMPKGTPLLGHVLQFKAENKHQVAEGWVKESGSLFKISFAGKKILVSADSSINEQILKRRPSGFRRFSKINETMEEMGISGVFNAEGEQWGNQRKVVAEALNLKNVKGFFPIIHQKTMTLLNRWKQQDLSAIDIQQEMMRYTVDITTSIAFGYDTNTLEKGDDVIQQHLEKIFPMINKRVTAPVPVWRFIKSKNDKELDRALLEIQKAVNEFIHNAKEQLAKHPELKESPANLLQAMLVQQEKQGRFTDHELFGNAFTMLLAGEDTTSNSISWTLYYLAQHPEVVKEIREETNRIFGDEQVPGNYEQLGHLKWSEAAAMEAMRLKPVTPMLYLEALEDVVIDNLEISKGTVIFLQNKVSQTHEHHFAQADKFLPSRWLANSKCPVHGAHTPDMIKAFGAGPRFCPGKNLAMVEMIMAVSMICHNFDIQLAGPAAAVKERYSFTMFPENLRINLQQRAVLADN